MMSEGDDAAAVFRVLLVNADHVTGALLDTLLGAEPGFELSYVSNAAAYETLDRDVAQLDAVVINISGGVTGFEIARHARLGNPGVSVIFLSSAPRDSIDKFGVVGAAHVRKPFDPGLLVMILRTLAAGEG